MSVEVDPDLEDPLVYGAQKKARARVCHDSESTTEGEPTNKRRLGFAKRLHRHGRLNVEVSDAALVTAILIADEKECVHVGSECRRWSVRVVDSGSFYSEVGPT